MEQTQVSFAKESHRCPFCHEQVATEQDEWVACKQCLARHHVGCWSEGSRCASCQHGTPLIAPSTGRFRPIPSADIAPLAEGMSADAIRFVTSQALDQEHRRHQALVTALLAPLTLGAYPVIQAEQALAQHRSRNRSEQPPLPNVAREIGARLRLAREHAFDPANGTGVVRSAIPCLVMVASMIVCIAFAIDAFMSHDASSLMTAWNAQLFAALATFGYLHVYRESVRRHEFHQFFIKLVSDAVTPARSKEVMKQTRREWNSRRALDAILTLLALVPGVGLALFPVAGARMRGALFLHEDHEEGFPRRR
jgi:hypothetical protein